MAIEYYLHIDGIPVRIKLSIWVIFLTVSTSCSSFYPCTSLKWISLPLHMRDPSASLHVFKGRLKFHPEKESKAVPIQVASTWRDFRFE